MNLSKTSKYKYKDNVQIQQYKEQRGECGSNQAKLSQKFLLSFPPSLSRAELNCGICILSNSDQKKLLSISRTKHILLFNMCL